jgi:2-polyprenyl-6-methoxyphenol hydroxylase-like FAD-dependent oxidoreductase
MRDRPDVLVVGAGPTGLTLALQARAHGADVRIVERRTDAFRPSRALIVHPRTLEVLRPLGVTDELMARADTTPRVCLHLGPHRVPVMLSELDLPDTAFPHLTMLRQADTETVLAQALARLGVEVEWATELVGVPASAAGPRARLLTRAGVEEVACTALVGCDGVESVVRTGLGIGWPGGTYGREVVLADLDLSDQDAVAPATAHVTAGRAGLLFLFALGEGAAWRLLATRPVGPGLPAPGRPGPDVPAGELQQMIDEAGLPATIARVAWSSRVRLQHRVASRYRRGRVFLAGDAAHASSPAGGTGMNTGIQDAANLGWKLALAATSGDPATLLASYELERRPVAQQVLALTHLIFWAESSTDPAASFLRGTLAPWLAPAVPWVMRRRRLLAEAVRLLSQLRTDYRAGPLSQEGEPPSTGGVRAGDRLPDATVVCDGRRTRLHELLARPGLHVLLDRDATPPGRLPAAPYLSVHRLTSAPGAGVVVVRPDGHVGFRSGRAASTGWCRWLDRFGGTSLTRPAGQAAADGYGAVGSAPPA